MSRVAISPGFHFCEIKQTKFLSNRVSIQLVVPLCKETASANALLAQVFRQGCEKYPTFLKLTEALYQLYGASFGSDVDQIGDKQIINIYARGMDERFALAGENITEALGQLVLDVLLRPRLESGMFPQEVVEIEKQNLMELIASEMNDKRYYAFHQAKKAYYKGTPFVLSKLGTVEDVQAITPASLTAQYERLMQEAQIEVFVSGGGDFTQVKALFEKEIGAISNRAPILTPMASFTPPADVQDLRETMDIGQGKLVLFFGREGTFAQGKANAYRLANAIFGRAPFSKLFVHVREEKSLCYYCDSAFDRVTGLLSVDSGVALKDEALATQTIIEQLEKMQKGEFSDEILAQGKLQLCNMFTALKDALSSQEGLQLANALYGRQMSIEEEIKDIESITKEEVAEAFAGYTLKMKYLLHGEA